MARTSPRRIVFALAVIAVVSLVAFLITRRDDDAPQTTPHSIVTGTTGAQETPTKKSRRATPTEDAPKPADAPTPPSAAPTRASLVVHVLAAEDRAPIAGAKVHVNDGKEVDHDATTDASGAARFADLPPGSTSAWADAAERLRSRYESRGLEAGKEASVELVLGRGVFLDGVVLDARDGRPVAGASVDVEEGGTIGDESSGWDAPALGHLVTGADGRFRVRVPPDEIVTANASARGFVAEARSFKLPADDATRPTAEFRLGAAGTLRGVVRDPVGRQAAGAKIYAIPADARELLVDPDREMSLAVRKTLVAVADREGRYALEGLAPGGSYVAFAAADGFGRSLPREGVLVTDATLNADADFALRRLATLTVHVVDADGRPTAAHVEVWSEVASLRKCDAGADGTVRIDRVDPSTYDLAASAPDTPAATAKVDVADGATAETTVRFERGVAITGVVVDDKGDPVAKADVTVSRAMGLNAVGLSDSNGAAKSGADGTFRVGGLRSGPHGVAAHEDGHAASEFVHAEAPSTNLRIVLPRLGAVSLRLVLPTGAAPPTEMTVFYETAAGFTDEHGRPLWGGNGTNDLKFGDGRIVLPWFKPGTCRVRVQFREFATLTTREFELAPGASVDLGDCALDPGIELVGRVEDASGAPIVGASVATGESFELDVRSATSSVDGGFRLPHLAPGRREIVVKATGFVEATIQADVAAGGAPLVARLTRGARLRVTVVDAAGAPVAGASIKVRAAGAAKDADAAARGEADNRGVFETRVAVGKYRVVVDGKDVSTDVELVEGGETSVRLVVK